MLVSRRILPVLSVTAALLSVLAVAPAGAVTVNLRVEGSTTTLFEGPIAAEPQVFETASSKGAHPCNYSENGGSESSFANGGTPSGTPTTALRAAALSNGLPFDAEWFGNEKNGGNPGDFFVKQVGSDINESSPPFASWGYAVNETTAPVGGCQIALAPGNEVLWAYNYFNLPHRLRLSGPASANAGTPFVVHVLDAQSGSPIAGSAIGTFAGGLTATGPGSPVTDAAGDATVTLSGTGTLAIKATRPESVRSNALVVCIHNGSDGTCGTGVPGAGPTPPASKALFEGDVALIRGLSNGHVYPRRRAPRLLAGVVQIRSGGTLRDVRISLERAFAGRCFKFSGTRERFVRVHRCGRASFFSVGGAQSFSYLLPRPLARGRYVFQIEAIESSGRSTRAVNGVSRVSFRVK